MSEVPKFNKKKVGIVIGLFTFFICLSLAFYGGREYEKAVFNPPEPEVKIIEKEKEVIKYVEKSKTATEDFLMHLNKDVDPQLAGIIAKAIDEASAKYRLPRKLVCSIIRKESNINPFARSKAGATGLMQIMPKIHKDRYEGRNLWHIPVNVDVGCQIFREYLDLEKGNMFKTFHRYLSKNATKDQINAYAGGIYSYWAKLEMFDYLSSAERDREQEEATEHPQQNTNGKDKEDDVPKKETIDS
jgi:hypothetical protein